MGVEMGVVYGGNLHCTATHGPSASTLTTDAPLDNGGRGGAFSPTDLVGASLGACILTILGLVARRRGLALEGTGVRVVKEMVSDPERRIGSLDLEVTFPPGCPLTHGDRAVLERSAEACPVRRSLHPSVAVAIRFVYPG
jgi:putative redox protein